MSIHIKENDKPNLKTCVMNCDKGLHDKLNQYELTKFINSHSTNLLIGRPGSGKSSLLYSLFKSNKLLKKVFHKIYVFMPSASRNSMTDNIFDTLPEDRVFEELTYDNLDYVLTSIKEDDPSYNNAIIMDDMTAYLKNKETLQKFKEIAFNKRHYHISLYVLSQTFYSVPKEIRKMFNNLFVFKVSKNELSTIFEEIIEVNKSKINEISKLVYNEPYQYLFINVESNRLFRGFDELLIEEEF